MAWSSPRTWTTGEVVTAAHMNQEIRDNFGAAFPNEIESVSWTPTLQATSSNPSTSAVTGKESRDGATQFVWIRFTISTAGSGTYFVELPRAPSGLSTSAGQFTGQVVGVWQFRNASTSASGSEVGSVQLAAGGTVRFNSEVSQSVMTDALPITKQNGDILTFEASYPFR